MGRRVYIERADFAADPPKKFFRLKPDGEVRLKGAYIIACKRWETDADGNVTKVICTYDPESKSGADARKVKGTLHWVNADDAAQAEFRLYEPLLTEETENDARDFIERLNPASLTVQHGFVEPALKNTAAGDRYQFMRVGYFCTDPDTTAALPVFNRVVGLKDSYKG